MDNLTGRPSTFDEPDAERIVRTALATYPRERLPTGFAGRVMAEVVGASRPVRPTHVARLSLVDIAIPAGVALLALMLPAGIAWLNAVDPTLLPRSAHWAQIVWSMVLPGLPRPDVGPLTLAASAAGLAALAVALITERHPLVPRAG